MRRILTFALLAAFALATSVPVSLVTAGKAAAATGNGHNGSLSPSSAKASKAHRGR